jgi:hypothetical protein
MVMHITGFHRGTWTKVKGSNNATVAVAPAATVIAPAVKAVATPQNNGTVIGAESF